MAELQTFFLLDPYYDGVKEPHAGLQTGKQYEWGKHGHAVTTTSAELPLRLHTVLVLQPGQAEEPCMESTTTSFHQHS